MNMNLMLQIRKKWLRNLKYVQYSMICMKVTLMFFMVDSLVTNDSSSASEAIWSICVELTDTRHTITININVLTMCIIPGKYRIIYIYIYVCIYWLHVLL